MHSSFTALVH